MENLIVCSKCGKPTITEKYVYFPKTIKEIPLEERKKHNVTIHTAHSIDGTLGLDFVFGNAPNQIVYTCGACGYTEVQTL